MTRMARRKWHPDAGVGLCDVWRSSDAWRPGSDESAQSLPGAARLATVPEGLSILRAQSIQMYCTVAVRLGVQTPLHDAGWAHPPAMQRHPKEEGPGHRAI